MFTTRHSGLAAANFALQVYCSFREACEEIEPLWKDEFEDPFMEAAELAALLIEFGLPAIHYVCGPSEAHNFVTDAWDNGYMALVQVRKFAQLQDRRWAVVMDFDGEYISWAECVARSDLPRGPRHWAGYFTGHMVVIEREVPDRPVVSVRMEGTLPFRPN